MTSSPKQCEPVTLPGRKDVTADWVKPGGCHRAGGWNACLDAVEKLGPLYTSAQLAEAVAGLRADLASALADKAAYAQNAIDIRQRHDALRDQMEHMKELARDSKHYGNSAWCERVDATLRWIK